ncbi:hypothetical protein [Longimicrobium sp.]|uniref:hypothetical protein n=1 Tax=Longimicrobium sp. TaxID=2029185 RepID=UPI002E36FC01|nr:hypothetical protein [Longimicrobium sp.]HEX6038302.1 hypothetical protein [Longimicrobium sp.]
MTNRIRVLAGSITLAGGALLLSARPAYSTMVLNPVDLGDRFCCAGDLNGDGKAETFCCYRGGCAVGPTGCTRASA